MADVTFALEVGVKKTLQRGVYVILFLLIPHVGYLDITHNDVAHLELAPIFLVVAPDIDTFRFGIIIIDNHVVVVVVEIVMIASDYFRLRDGIPLEVIGIAVCNILDAVAAIGVAIALSTLRIAQDDPADGIAVVSLYGDAGTLCQLVDGTVARSAGGLAIAELNFHLPLSESSYRLVLAYPLHGLA